MKLSLIPVTLFLLVFSASAQDAQTPTDWITKGSTGLNFAQSSLSNWSAGGENSLATTGILTFTAEQKYVHYTWTNNLDMAYGVIKQGDKGFRKSDDKFNFLTKFGRSLSPDWNLTFLFELKTQLDVGYKYETVAGKEVSTFVSRFMSPGYVNASLGFDFRGIPNLQVFMTPATGKATYVLDDKLNSIGAYGVKKGKNALYEFGAYVNARYQMPVFENINYLAKLDLFSAYDKMKYVDINFENLVTFKVNEYVNASLSVQTIYDDDIVVQKDNGKIGRAVQFKEVIAIGVAYTF